ncbi:hypothetical protein DM02DRAFT_682802 [Periconia macrospinosa]|uniref:F-box domain-containing protein n=1 Tax=Periconia macrospinosa TaxID=97972 RepID=A0A2V1E708_9PLEO|nr:hypothetical protein DM02DRAFT_682802 [Periconia macrospinosa]
MSLPSDINVENLKKMSKAELNQIVEEVAQSTSSNTDSLTYTHDVFRNKWFYLDRILDNTMPLFSSTSPPTQDLGALSALPNELLYTIFSHLPITSLMRFRRCNRLSSLLITSIPSLRAILHTAPNTIKGILALQISTPITLTQLRQKLTQRTCDGCGDLGGLIYLPTCQRACFYCLHAAWRRYYDAPKTKTQLETRFAMTPVEIAALPTLRSLPGTFTDGTAKFTWQDRATMYVRPGKFWNEDAKTYGGLCEMNLGDKYRKLWDDRGDDDDEPVLVKEDPMPWQVQYHMTSVLAPWMDPKGQEWEEGVFCSNCVGSVGEDVVYDKVSFGEHMRECRAKTRRAERWRTGRWREVDLWLCGLGEDK